MKFDWKDFIALAETLYHQANHLGQEEACLRSAISRAYYGAYGLAREVARRKGVPLSGTPQDHAVVTRHFRRAPEPLLRKVGLELGRLRRMRNQADYDEHFPRVEKETLLALKRARQIQKVLSRPEQGETSP